MRTIAARTIRWYTAFRRPSNALLVALHALGAPSSRIPPRRHIGIAPGTQLATLLTYAGRLQRARTTCPCAFVRMFWRRLRVRMRTPPLPRLALLPILFGATM